MIQKLKAPGGGPGAEMDATRRGVLSYPNFTKSPSDCQIPDHLTPSEGALWLAAEQVKNTDYDRFCDLRRALLLAQTARWQPTT